MIVSRPLLPLFWHTPLFWVACMVIAARVIAGAAVFDDSYITFRVVDNFTSGYGLRWNIDERVQVYTHPLWMLLHIPLHLVINNFYIASILLSFVCSGMGLWLLLTSVPLSRWHALVLVGVPLFLSNTFNSYYNCGLETPLSFCLLVWFSREYLQKDARCERLCLIASLVLLTRFDNATLVMPALLFALWEQRRTIRWGKLLVALSPLLVWCTFCLFYYGFILPNTKYAKTNTGIPALTMAWQGIKYSYNLSYYDTLAFVLVAACIGVSLKQGFAMVRKRTMAGGPMVSGMDTRLVMLASGVTLNLLYIIAVGGDYMCGRFFWGALVLALVLMVRYFYTCTAQMLWIILVAQLGIKATEAIVIRPIAPDTLVHTKDFGINDHHSLYYFMNGLFSDKNHWLRTSPDYYYVLPKYDHSQPHKVVVEGYVGYNAFPGPREMIVIDYHGLTDALLARLPVPGGRDWRIGHFPRDLPGGYVFARQSDDTSLLDPLLEPYYQKLRLVTSGDLWDPERLKAILGFHLGWYDHWLTEYWVSSHQQ